MSAKFIHTLSDENPDLQKQIGCMNGIFQLFERGHFLGSRRQITGSNHKKQPSGENGNNQTKSSSQKTTEKDQKKAIKEKQRISTESSRTSFSSSSCSSSLSSFECNNRASQLEPCSFNQTTAIETHDRESPIYQLKASFRSSQQSHDLRDVVKDSIYREARGLLVKTVTKGDSGGHTLKYFDSPRPMQNPKSPNPKIPNLRESFQVLHKLQEVPRKSNEERRASLPSALKDARRVSCDGRESRNTSKTTIKLKELPRLSLDSRAGSIKGSTTEMKSNYLLGNLERRDRNSDTFSNQQEEPESRTKLSNVVAKLMGLEALPDSMSANENQTRHITAHSSVESHRFLGSPKTTEDNKQSRVPGSPRNLHKEPVSPRTRNADSIKKPSPNSRFPLEPAPWKQPDGNRSNHTPALKNRVAQPKVPDTPLTVYGEIEKRLAQLEFKQSGKDLRALKQILEAMQKTKDILKTNTETPKSETQTNSSSSLQNNSKSSNLCNIQNESPISTITRGSSSPNNFKSPIVIMKPAKLMQNTRNSASLVNPTESFFVPQRLQTADFSDGGKESSGKQTAQDLTPRSNAYREKSSLSSSLMDKKSAAKFARLPHSLKETQSTRESTKLARSSGTLNQTHPPKKFGMEKQTRPKSPSSDSIRNMRHASRQQTESGSSRRNPRSRVSNLQPSDDELSDVSSDVRDLSHHGDGLSLQSESHMSLASQADEEVSSLDRSYKLTHQKPKKPVAGPMKDRPVAEPVLASEQPSPVSVLDAAFYSDELPSPIKKRSIPFKDDEDEWNQVDENHSSCSTESSLNSAISHKKVESINLLIQKITQKLSAHETPEITNFYYSTNPDHQYISEILSASDLLKDFESAFATNHLHQTGYPIDHAIFLSLEKARASTMISNDKDSRTKISKSKFQSKLHRKLLFDVVNEILIHKILQESSFNHGLPPSKLADIRPGEQLLREEMCSEVDRLQGNAANCSLDDEEDSLIGVLRADLMHQSKNWTACSSEIPGIVLDIERLIFKDLISETVTGEALGLPMRSAGHGRQLYLK
ncbi:protein LONGIFOLIA 1-like [Mercurialis annua]|uniref:protein LONGIFOLIA 1-like n=1 Tax=Mercurialis annua TaxID=3986 RepID=UPI0021603A4E|nr:protein LONGIFOLIA 1-like [Mercurialis annua]